MRNATLLFFTTLFALNSSAQDKRQIKNLKTFAEVYGYVKYFHPSDAAAELDWNSFAIHGSKEIRKAKSQAEALSTLKKLFKPIAPKVIFSNQEFDISSSLNPNPENITYWQHYGLGIGTSQAARNIYKSVRVNKTTKKQTASTFGNIIRSLDGEKYKGKEFKYTAWAKLKKGSKGHGRIWLRVDTKDDTPGFFDNMGNNPIQKNEWAKYEINGKVDELAKDIVFGCFLFGKGELLVDNVTMSIKDADNWIPVKLEGASFEEVKFDNKNKKTWSSKGKGYNYEAVNSDVKHGKQAGSIKYSPIIEPVKGDTLFEYKLTGKEIIHKNIGNGIYCHIPMALNIDKNKTLPESNTELLKKLSKRIDQAPNKPSSLDFRLGNIINTYNVFQHFYPYFDVVDVDWNSALTQALQDSYTDKNTEEHVITLQKFTAKLKDGHIRVRGLNKTIYTPPIEWEWVENKLIISKTYDGTNLKIGDEVTQINGKPSKVYFAEVNARISGSEGWKKYQASYRSLYGDKNSVLSVQVNGKEHKLIRDTDYYGTNRYKRENQTTHRKISDEIYYLNLDIISYKKLEELMPELEKANSLIFDLRGYPNNNHTIISHLLKEEDTHNGWMQIPNIIFPNQKNIIGYKKSGWGMTPTKPYLGDKKIIFITDGSAISYAESVMGFIEGYKLATIVGQPTAGANGNINPFEIAGGLSISWTGMKTIKHDGTQQHNIGITPNIYVNKTIEGIIAGRDEFLDQAIKIANNEK